MIFTSDNWAGAHPDIARALSDHSGGFAAAYGASDLDRAVERRFSELFETEVAVFFVGTGTAANSLALASAAKPGGVAFAHHQAHIIADECGAPEFFSGGGRLAAVDGGHGKIDPENLEMTIARYPAEFVHAGQPVAVSITQATESGTVYSTDEIRRISAIAEKHHLPLHMDGARFANALVALDVSPAEMTIASGIDMLSFGGTKNGCWCAEALIVFDPGKAEQLPFLRKRGAHLFSKSRFIAAQFAAYLHDDLWLRLAGHANRMADQMRQAITLASDARLAWPSQTNEVFAILPQDTAAGLRHHGAQFYDWPVPKDCGAIAPQEVLVRLVTSLATTPQEIDSFASHLR
ncbi:threonine aldolase family protein [Pseudohoeflea coraliihabitans]|uniref:L-threonine aldolase n=1 Tax=Pseudohoeflea coraliihabitans TaxID=2860393 RepID=A0ABS6WK55_9HYPH|nr:low specificity L-threonine aldolase [Pseudohoeflea sp. DP4N28-3]MBW3096337.1 low specificity L-threonine aldolase [Pseudohoeflea sp. DP4N28-3]